MKTVSRGTRNPGRGFHVGLALTLSASLALVGTGFWLELGPGSPLAAAMIPAGALLCLIGGMLIAGSARALRQEIPEAARGPIAVPRPRGAEEAAALAHAQKMEALGLLAGGVAHDVNNQLHVIRNSLEILQRQDPPAEARRSLDMIRRSTDRAAGITRQLLAFSRRQPLDLRPIDPNDLVAQMAELLRRSLGERITIATTLGPGVWNVTADAGQLETALLNLAINARDAMSRTGLLTIETANSTLDETSAAARSPSTPNQYVMIAVSDTGEGMAPEVAARACEPFFTTKEPGHGTGLGLSQVSSFIRQSGGHVRISSELGKGTTVRLYLPKSASGGRVKRETAPARWTPPARPIKQVTQGVALAVGAGSG